MRQFNSYLALLLLMLAVGVVPAAQDTDGEEVYLKGHVNARVDLAITPEAIAGSLQLLVQQSFNIKVATILEYANTHGYTVDVKSQNAFNTSGNQGYLLRQGGTERINYDITYRDVDNPSGSPVNLTAGVAQVTDEDKKTKKDGETKYIRIRYDGWVDSTGAILTPGIYSDTLTFTISAK